MTIFFNIGTRLKTYEINMRLMRLTWMVVAVLVCFMLQWVTA